MLFTPRYILILIFALTAACSKGTTAFSVLDQTAIPKPLFNGSSTLNLTVISATDTNTINGQCDPRIHALQFTSSGTTTDFSQSGNFTTGGVTLACGSGGTFSLTLKSLTDLGYQIALNTTYSIQLRAVTDGGTSDASTINILYSTSGLGPKRVQISSGANLSSTSAGQPRLASGTTFQAELRVGHTVNSYSAPSSPETMAVKTGTKFMMKSGIAADHD